MRGDKDKSENSVTIWLFPDFGCHSILNCFLFDAYLAISGLSPCRSHAPELKTFSRREDSCQRLLCSLQILWELSGVHILMQSSCFITEVDIIFSLSKPTATCCDSLTCFVDYVQTLSCILQDELGAGSYTLTATWYVFGMSKVQLTGASTWL